MTTLLSLWMMFCAATAHATAIAGWDVGYTQPQGYDAVRVHRVEGFYGHEVASATEPGFLIVVPLVTRDPAALEQTAVALVGALGLRQLRQPVAPSLGQTGERRSVTTAYSGQDKGGRQWQAHFVFVELGELAVCVAGFSLQEHADTVRDHVTSVAASLQGALRPDASATARLKGGWRWESMSSAGSYSSHSSVVSTAYEVYTFDGRGGYRVSSNQATSAWSASDLDHDGSYESSSSASHIGRGSGPQRGTYAVINGYLVVQGPEGFILPASKLNSSGFKVNGRTYIKD